MGDRGPTWAVTAVSAVVMAGALSGCGSDDDLSASDGVRSPGEYTVPPPTLDPIPLPGLGLGDGSGAGVGYRRVHRASDPEAGSADPASRTVTALVEICAEEQRSAVPVGSDWALVLDDGDRTPAAGDPQPTDDGAPALPDSGRISPGECAFADVDFDVPEGSVPVGLVYHASTGAFVRWSWPPDATRPD